MKQVSQTQKEIWIREAAARLSNPKQRNTIEDDIEAITAGVKFLVANEAAKQLAFKVIDVVYEKIGILLKNMIQASYDRPDVVVEMQRSEEEVLKDVADTLGIGLE